MSTVDKTARNKLGVVSVGAGYFGRFHIDAWQSIDAVELLGIADAGFAQGQKLIDSPSDTIFPEPPVSEDAYQLCRNLRPDIIDLATPPPTHLPLLRQLLPLKPKVIICQKPFCAGVSGAREAIKLSRQFDVPIVVHENFRFQPWYRFLSQELASGSCGEVYQFTFRLRTGDGQGPDAYLARQPYFQTMPRLLMHETGVHWIDTFRYLLGEPQAVYADLRKLNPVIKGEDAGYFILDYQSGTRAMFDGNRLLDLGVPDNRLTLGEALLEGSSATLRLDGDGTIHRRAFGHTEFEPVFQPAEYSGFGGDCVLALQNHVVDAVLSGKNFENEASEYIRNLEIVEAVYKSAETGSRVVL